MAVQFSKSRNFFCWSSASAIVALTFVSLCAPLNVANGQIAGVFGTKNTDEFNGFDEVAANPEWAIQDILTRLVPPDADSIDRYQFEVNLRLADMPTLFEISKTSTFQDATGILLNDSAKLDSSGGDSGQQAIGSLDRDYVYTAVTPCRIVDTRPSQGGGGIILGKSTRDFYVYGDSLTISSQGGNPSGCLSPRGEPRAVHINATVVPPENGFLTVYPANIAQLPTVSLLNYKAGVNIANAGIIQTQFAIGPPELRVYANGDTHVIIDVLGYFHEAGAIDPSLLPVTSLFTVTSSDGSGVALTSCPAGSLVTSANCDCDNVNGTRNFGVLFGCQVAGNGAIAGCFSEGVTFDPFLPSPLATVTAMCVQSVLPAGATTLAKPDADDSALSKVDPVSPELQGSTMDSDLANALQSVREQVSTHRQRLEATK